MNAIYILETRNLLMKVALFGITSKTRIICKLEMTIFVMSNHTCRRITTFVVHNLTHPYAGKSQIKFVFQDFTKNVRITYKIWN